MQRRTGGGTVTRAGNTRVRVIVSFVTDIPSSLEERLEAYGTTDPKACIDLDIESDAMALVMDADDVVCESVEVLDA